HPVVGALVVLALMGVALPALGATAWGLDFGRWAVQTVPGAGLLRDAQKWVALAAPLYALAAAAAVMRRPPTWSVAAILVILLALPDLVWGVGGALRPVRYPQSWEHVATDVSADRDGDVAVLPAGMFRKFPYTGEAPILDPAPRLLPADVLQTGELVVAGGTVAGEGSRAQQVEQVLLDGGSGRALAELGVRWVLFERDTPGPLGESARTLEVLEPVFTDQSLELYRVRGDIAPHDSSEAVRAAVIAAHGLWALLLVGGLLGAGVQRSWTSERRRHQS
ncbi:MAG: hypothetical protein WAW17_15465, partial [Rhodococcus sp. (in: high G+C Gram-positive bacteria)]